MDNQKKLKTNNVKTFQFRIYPDQKQRILMAKTMGCSRFVYNHFLNRRINHYQATGKGLDYKSCAKELTALKKGLPWLKEPDSTSLQRSLKNLDDAYDRFFKGQNKFPKFKKKADTVQSYTSQNNVSKSGKSSIWVEDRHIVLPKVGAVTFAKSREIKGRILRATVKRKSSGRYYIAITVQTDHQALPKTGQACSLDLGIQSLMTGSAFSVLNPRPFHELEEQLAREQRKLARRHEVAKKDGKKLSEAKNYQKQRKRVAKIHERITNKRMDYLHKLSWFLVKNHDLIAMESLQIKAMLQEKNLSKAISDSGWGNLIRMLEYKSLWYGRQLVKVDPYFPSSQLCHACGHRYRAAKSLAIRQWVCPSCQALHHRDENAAYNILAEAKRTVGATGIA